MLRWLEAYLIHRRQALLVISHDRYLLDRLAERLFIFGEGGLEDYPGSYSEWEERENAPAV